MRDEQWLLFHSRAGHSRCRGRLREWPCYCPAMSSPLYKLSAVYYRHLKEWAEMVKWVGGTTNEWDILVTPYHTMTHTEYARQSWKYMKLFPVQTLYLLSSALINFKLVFLPSIDEYHLQSSYSSLYENCVCVSPDLLLQYKTVGYNPLDKLHLPTAGDSLRLVPSILCAWNGSLVSSRMFRTLVFLVHEKRRVTHAEIILLLLQNSHQYHITGY